MRRQTWDDMGDRPMLGWLGTPTPVVKKLLIANAIVFGLQTALLLLGSMIHDDTSWRATFDAWFGLSGSGVRSGWLWQLGTYMFLHSVNLLHILFNLFALWMFGREVEDWLGSRRFLELYLVGGFVGGLCWLGFNWSGAGPLMGASAAVYAVCIAFATLVPDRQITLLLFFIIPVTMKAKWWAWITVALVAYSSFVEANGRVAHLAHLGGIAVGYLFVKSLGHGAPSKPVELFQALLRPLSRIGQRRRQPDPEDMPPETFISEQVDPILDKIAREGIHSLTARERKILEAARGKIERKTGGRGS